MILRAVIRSVIPRTGNGLFGQVQRGRRVLVLLWSGLFDRKYYEAQRGRSFRSAYSAAADYLAFGRVAGLAPSPLFEPEWFRPEDWRGPVDPVLRWIGRKAGRQDGTPGPLFDPAVYLRAHPRVRRHPGGPLGHFLRHASPEDPLPVGPDHIGTVPTWGAARALLMKHASAFGASVELRAPRRVSDWDLEADRAFVTRWRAAELPMAVHGNPLVSIVMPVRNRPVLVQAAIASIQAQTLLDWELVVVDDGSTDDTAEQVEQLAREDPRIRLLRRPAAGVSAARNAALHAVRGRYVAFLDSDNEWEPYFLWVMLASLRARGLRAGHAVVDWGGEGTQRYLAFDGGLDHLLVQNHVSLVTLVVEREVIEKTGCFDEELRRWVDHDLAIRIARITPLCLVPFVGLRVHDERDATSWDRITLREHSHWQYVALAKHHVDWQRCDRELGARHPSRVSVCLSTHNDWELTVQAVRAVLAHSGDHDVEVVVMDNGSRRAVGSLIEAVFAGEPRVRLVSMVRNLNPSIGSNVAFAASTGASVVFLRNTTEVGPGWLTPLLAPLADRDVRGTQPLLLHVDGTIRSAGWLFLDSTPLPSPFLAGHPTADAVRAAPIRLTAVTAEALAMRAEEVVALHGFDPMLVGDLADVDLCLRAVESHGGSFAVVPESVVIGQASESPGWGCCGTADYDILRRRWAGRLPASDALIYERLGLVVSHLDPGSSRTAPSDIPIPSPVLVRSSWTGSEGTRKGRPSLRWAIKVAAPIDSAGEGWEDVRCAATVARDLERLGQQVAVDRLESHDRPTSHLDDVVLCVRGPVPLPIQLGRINVLWVVSHPELVTASEVRGYDAVFAASPEWVARLEEWSVETNWLSCGTGAECLLEAVLLRQPDQCRGRLDTVDVDSPRAADDAATGTPGPWPTGLTNGRTCAEAGRSGTDSSASA